MAFSGLDQGFYDFFNELMSNNERAWFTENKERYKTEVVAPLQALITEMGPLLQKISEHFIADPRGNGGSMFRIYRDTRFSKDKTPYKTHAAVQFRHALGKDVHAPGFYVHFSPREVVYGLGIWHPDGPSLAKIREYMVEHPQVWRDAIEDAGFQSTYELAGERLKRPPRGFPKDHELIEDLKRKDFIGICEHPPMFAMTPDFPKILAEDYQKGKKLMAFLCKAVGVPF